MVKCEWCENEYYVPKHKLQDGRHLFCSKQCRKDWYANIWSQSEEWKEESRKRATSLLKNNPIDTNTKPQIIMNEILDDLGIKYTNEYSCVYYSIDNYLDDYNLMIEVMGDFWHCTPIKYNDSNMRDIQKKRIVKDKAKKSYIKNQYDVNILYIWESDLYTNVDLCSALVKMYIERNGVLNNYHSFNYHIEENQIKLNDTILVPRFEISSAS